jgi:hypothetical protein
VQVNPLTGLPTGGSFEGDAIAGGVGGGGAAITTDLIADKLVFIGLHQATVDTVVGYDLGVSTGICGGGDASWLSVSDSGGVILVGSGEEISVEFDSNGLTAGFYSANLCVSSTDPDNPLVVIPVQLIVGYDNQIYLPIIQRDP